MATSELKLYGHPESGHSYKVRLLLVLARIEHDYEVADILLDRDRRSEPFRSLSLRRFGEVPLLVSGEDVLVQSNAILIHVASRWRVFGGDDPVAMERAREWLFWEANRLGLSLPHLRLARNYFPADYPEGTVEWLQERYRADSIRLERELEDGRPFILGDRPTIADMSLCGYLYWANQAGVQVLPRTCAWLARIAALPGWESPYRLLDPSGEYRTFGIVKGEFVPQVPGFHAATGE